MDRQSLIEALGCLPPAELAEILAPLLAPFGQRPLYSTYFHIFERVGVHVTPADFYSPIPELRTLPESTWRKRYEMTGVDLNESYQVRLLTEVFPRFREECAAFPVSCPLGYRGYHLRNGMFDGVDALLYYCMIRHFAPKRVLEVGAGYSSLIAAAAAKRNEQTEVVCIEPFPSECLLQAEPAPSQVLRIEVQQIEPSFFEALEPGDFLFVDSSHCSRIGSDVNYLFLEVIPRLRPGVFVHVHDVFLPFEPYREAVEGMHLFWNEQYLFHAFLLFNSAFEVVLANRYLGAQYEKQLRELFPTSPWYACGGSFWLRRKST
jgi:hypothetical protein